MLPRMLITFPISFFLPLALTVLPKYRTVIEQLSAWPLHVSPKTSSCWSATRTDRLTEAARTGKQVDTFLID